MGNMCKVIHIYTVKNILNNVLFKNRGFLLKDDLIKLNIKIGI